jgi:hypothetical protein
MKLTIETGSLTGNVSSMSGNGGVKFQYSYCRRCGCGALQSIQGILLLSYTLALSTDLA